MNSTSGKTPAFRGRIYDSIVETVGQTPLVRLPKLAADAGAVADILGKCEFFNPLSSVKDRIGLAMIEAAEAAGKIKPGDTIVEPTSGNTGIALAFVCAAKGYKLILTMPDSMSIERRKMLSHMGAKIVLTPAGKGMRGAVTKAEEIVKATKGAYMPQQFENPANPEAHRQTTAEEIWAQTKGTVTHFIAGLGTTGTFIGTARRLKELNPMLRAIAVQPDAALHGLEGLKHLDSAIVPGIYDPSIPDDTVFMPTEAAYEAVDRLVQQEGLLVGPSSGAALTAGLQLAKELASAHLLGVLVMIFPDAGARYAVHSTPLKTAS